MGSNPIPSIDSSVRRITTENKEFKKTEYQNKNSNNSKPFTNYSGCKFNNLEQVNTIVINKVNRDIYNRPKKLEHWKDKAKSDLDSSDVTDVFRLIEPTI